MKHSKILGLALVAGAVLAASPTWADDDGKKLERREVRVMARDGEEPRVMVFEGDGEGRALRRVGPLLGRGYLGIETLGLTSELREHFGAPKDAGILVSRVVADSPAAQAGIKVGDVIASVDGENVDSSWDLTAKIRPHDKGDNLTVEVIRNGRPVSLRATVGERDRQVVDVAPMMEWHGGGPEGQAMRFHLRPETAERLRDLDIDGLVQRELERSGVPRRAPGELERRLAELEKRLAELTKQLEKLGEKK
ncbi:MAG TPA: PDZ domain-containing protein [Thermoanaerobaculia bacterium]|nr:PDZ domain-containing protein [Thermoanaerobaculia bacterium]